MATTAQIPVKACLSTSYRALGVQTIRVIDPRTPSLFARLDAPATEG